MEKYLDKIQVCNEDIFNDNETHTLEMYFYNGYAISIDNKYGMTYPTLEQVAKTPWMQCEINAYCGDNRTGDCVFDIALKYGVLFQLPHDTKSQLKIEWLEQFALRNPNRKAVYEKFCTELDAPNKEYFVLWHDRTGDGGMCVQYLGECNCDEEAKNKAFDTGAMPKDAAPYYRAEDIKEAEQAVSYGEGMNVVAVYCLKSESSVGYFTIVASNATDNKYAAFVWNRHDNSMHVSNSFSTFASYTAMQNFVMQAKVDEMKEDLVDFNVTWWLQNLSVDCGLTPDKTLHNIKIWSDNGYEVWICCGTYK